MQKVQYLDRNFKNKEEYRQRKIDEGCSICGYNKCATSLHYHHTDPKTKVISICRAYTSNWKKERIDKELAKCILVCANCHGEIEEGLVEIGSDANG